MKKILVSLVAFVVIHSITLAQTGDETLIPDTGMSWPENQVIPTFAPPAKNLDAINVEGKPRDVQTMMVGLQGLLNRKQPRLLVLNRNNNGEQWPEAMGLRYKLENDPYRIIEKYKREIKGLIVYDPKVDATVNLATTLAGLEDALIVSPELAKILQDRPHRFKVIQDFNGMFTDKYTAYDYAYKKLLPRCTKRMIIGLAPGAHHAHLRDLAVATKAMVVWFDPNHIDPEIRAKQKNGRDEEFINKFLKEYNAMSTYYLGWWPDEGAGIYKSSKYGIPTIPADFFENMTVYASLPKELSIPSVPAKPKLENKFYLALVFSDGDNLQYCEHALKTSDNLWSSKLRGTFPMNWTMSPPLLDAAPQMLNYYYKTASDNDCIVSGPSGLGYTDPQYWSKEPFERYVQLTDHYFRRTGFNIATIWNKLPTSFGKVYEQYGKSLIGITAQEPLKDQPRIEVFNKRLPRILLAPRYDGDGPRHEKIMREHILRWKESAGKNPNRPEFWASQPVAWEMGMRDTKKMIDGLKAEFGDELEIVRMDHLMMLHNEWNSLPYNVALRAETFASSTAKDFDPSNLVDGSFTTGWQSATKGNHWVGIDLKTEHYINRYVIKNAETAYHPKNLNTKTFKVEASIDGSRWRDVDTIRSNSDAIVDKTINTFQARYIRISISDAGGDGIGRLQEIELHGNPKKLLD